MGVCSILLEIYDCFLQRGQKVWEQMKLSLEDKKVFWVIEKPEFEKEFKL